MVHGSPKPESNRDMFAVVELVEAQNAFNAVQVGFMECNEPDIPTAIEALVAQGVQSVIAVPYFLHSGSHVADDLPTHLEAAQVQYPDVSFLMGDFLGHDPLIAEVVTQRVQEVA